MADGKPAPSPPRCTGGTERVATGRRRAARTARDSTDRTLARALILVPPDEGEPRRRRTPAPRLFVARDTQAPMPSDPPLTLDVADCGPVARACVELRPLTVFVGPSNTGKSWLATLAYALHRYFGTDPGWLPRFLTGIAPAALPEGAPADLLRTAGRDLAAAVSRSAESGEEDGIELTAPLKAAVRLHAEEQGGAIGKEIERCFGLDGGRLIRAGSAGDARIRLRHEIDGVSTLAAHELKARDGGWTFLPTVPDGLRIRSGRLAWLARLLPTEDESGRAQAHRAWNAVGALARYVLPKRRPAFYLPADRTGLMNAHATVVSALIQSATMAGIRRADPVPPLSGVRGDFLEQLVEMVSSQPGRVRRGRRDREGLRRLGKRIEDGILGGAVKVGGLPGVAYPHFTYLPRGWKSGLPLTNASSMVSELAPVVLYLRHVVSPDDLLIIDEPESHLHPAMQVAFTRQIAAIAGAGVRVLLTTHSEWVLEALGNVVGRAGLPDRGPGQGGREFLDANSVGVWLFEPAEPGRGSTVREIALDADTGLYPSGFDSIASVLHNDWAEIASRRGDAR